MTEKTTITLRGLPGVSGTLEAERASSRTAAIGHLRRGVAISASGDSGAINVWKDDDGRWRCEFMQHRRTVDSANYKSLAAVDQWLSDWFPKL